MNILIIGASGLTGKTLFKMLGKEHNVYGTYCSQRSSYMYTANMYPLDDADISQLDSIFKLSTPQIIISCLRGDFENLLRLHKIAANYLTNVNDGKLIFLSTANVFDEADKSPHYENDSTVSNSDYGQFKINCEKLITDILGKNSIIIRIPFIWGKDSPRLKRIIQSIESGIPVDVWSNLYTNHTTDMQIYRYINTIIANELTGVFHVGSNDTCEYMDFIKKLVVKLRLSQPEFNIKELPYKSYLAVLSARNDIPAKLKITNDDILDYLADSN